MSKDDSEYWADVEYEFYLFEINDHASHVDAWIEQQLYAMGVKTLESEQP